MGAGQREREHTASEIDGERVDSTEDEDSTVEVDTQQGSAVLGWERLGLGEVDDDKRSGCAASSFVPQLNPSALSADSAAGFSPEPVKKARKMESRPVKGVDASFRDSVFVCFLLVPSDHSIQRTSPSGPLSSASAHLTLLQRGLPFSCLSSLTMSDRRPPSVRQALSDVTNRPPPHAASAAGHFHTALTSAAHNLKTARG